MANNRWRICGRVKKFTWSYKQSKQRSTWKSELENRWSGFKFMWYTNGSLRGHILQKQMILYLHIWLFTSSPSHANTQKHTLRGWMREKKNIIHTRLWNNELNHSFHYSNVLEMVNEMKNNSRDKSKQMKMNLKSTRFEWAWSGLMTINTRWIHALDPLFSSSNSVHVESQWKASSSRLIIHTF